MESLNELPINLTDIPGPTFIQKSIQKGLVYLESVFNPKTCFQHTHIGTGSDRNTLRETDFYQELIPNLFALDLLDKQLSETTVKILREYIYPKHQFSTINHFLHDDIVPDDTENTAFVYWYLLKNQLIKMSQLEILNIARAVFLNVSSSGVIQVYTPPMPEFRKNRVDAASLCIVMRFLYFLGLESEAKVTEEYIFKFLTTKEYRKGCRYYPTPDAFLQFCARAISQNEQAFKKFERPLYQELQQRLLESPNNGPIALSMRIIALAELKRLNEPEISEQVNAAINYLIKTQNLDGSWEKDLLYGMPRSNICLGGQNISTIFCVAALSAYYKHIDPLSS